jgi:glycosyltransferase involved in cell wall biosynthesis
VKSEAQSAGGAIRLAVVTETFPPEINGVAHTMGHLVAGLAARGHRLQVVRPRQPGSAGPAIPRVRECLVAGLPLPGYRGLRFGLPAYWRLRRLWAEDRPDICYIATQGPLGHTALWAAHSLGIPAVTGFHTQFHQYSRHYGLGGLGHQIMRALRRFHNRSQATLVPTAELRWELTALGFQRVRLFTRGVDTQLFCPSRRGAERRRTWGCSEGTLAVLYVGRIASEKNLALAIAAFAAIREDGADAKFILVGDGPELSRLRQAHPDLVFTGAKTGIELAEHYASGDLFLFPSLTETFGNVVPQAMASGLPAVAFDYAAAKAHIRDGENGIRVPLGNDAAFIHAAREVARDRDELRILGKRARATAEELSWERVLAAFEEELRQIIPAEGGPGQQVCSAPSGTR